MTIILGFIGSMLILWLVIFGGTRAIVWLVEMATKKKGSKK